MRLRNADETASAEKIITSTLQFSSFQIKRDCIRGFRFAKGSPETVLISTNPSAGIRKRRRKKDSLNTRTCLC